MRNKERNSYRLENYDYGSAGSYFITIVCNERKHWFGEIKNGLMFTNKYGDYAYSEWYKTSEIRNNVSIGAFIVMPNHIHGIITINFKSKVKYSEKNVEGTESNILKSPSQTIGAIVRGYKSAVTKFINTKENTCGGGIWQAKYWDHIIRTQSSYLKISEYIINNPKNREEDRFFKNK